MLSQPLVSINITTYNRALKLRRCLKSVLKQSYNNYEIIVIDDYSEDNTEEIVSSFSDPRIRYFRHEHNMGNAISRNTALSLSKGHYVAFLDDDDEWIDFHKLKEQVEIFENSFNEKLGIVCSSVRLFKDSLNFTDKTIIKPKNIKSHILKQNGIIYSPTVMTKRSIMLEVGGFDKKLPRGIDSDFYRNCILKFNYDVFFMLEVTTAVHEYGSDRMTELNKRSTIMKGIRSHYLTLMKYFCYYLLAPTAFLFRIRKIIHLLKMLVKNDIRRSFSKAKN